MAMLITVAMLERGHVNRPLLCDHISKSRRRI